MKTPAAPASAEPMKNVTAITRFTSMPIISAACRSNDTARIARPSCVRDTNHVSATISTSAPTITMIWASATWTPPGRLKPVLQSTPPFHSYVS